MSDIKIPNLNKNSDKYLFKKKLNLRRKSKRKLVKESILMLLLSTFLLYVNYLIPNKKVIIDNFPNNLSKTVGIVSELVSYLYEIFLILFIVISLIIAVILIIGSLARISKVIKRKTKKIPF